MKRLCSLCNELRDDDEVVEGKKGRKGTVTGKWVCASCRGRMKFKEGGA